MLAYKKTVLSYAPLALLVTGLAGCAPAYVPEPIYSAPPPQALPLPMPQPMPPQPQVQAPMPVQQQPKRVETPPTVTPIEARTKIVAEPLPEPSMPKKSSGPAVSYIPEKPAASSSQTTTQAKPQGVPFWDQGKVQVEVLDMPAEKTPTPSTNTMVPPQSGTGSTQQSMSTSSSMSSSASSSTTSSSSGSSSSSSSPVVAVLLKQANNELSVGKADRAATTLERALRIAPDDANLWLRLAEVNEQLGNKTQASSMARKALDLAPDDAAIRLRAQRLVN